MELHFPESLPGSTGGVGCVAPGFKWWWEHSFSQWERLLTTPSV